MGKAETRLTDRMRKAGKAEYGDRLVLVKYHGDQYARAGVSDLLACLDGVFIACEVKAPESYPVKGEPSVERALRDGPTVLQRAFVQHVLDAGGCAGFAAIVPQFMEMLAHASDRGWRQCIEQCSGHFTTEGHNS